MLQEDEVEMWHDIDHAVERRNFASLVSICHYYIVKKVESTGKGLEPTTDTLSTIT